MKHIQITKPESPISKSHSNKVTEKMVSQFAANAPKSGSPPFVRVSSVDMLTKLLKIGVIGLMLCAANAWAGPASIHGIVKDAKGQPIKNADVRIESRDGKQLFNTAKTDSQGRYISQGLQPGVYRVTLLVNGAVKASIMNTQTKADQPTQLNFEFNPPSQAGNIAKGGKHMVWVPSRTGSHIGGNWAEVPDGAAESGTLNVQTASGEELQRQALQSGNPNITVYIRDVIGTRP